MLKENDENIDENGRQFQVLNKISDNKKLYYKNESDKSFSYDSNEETMLEQEPEEFENGKRRKTGEKTEVGEKSYTEKDKHVLIEKGQNYFDALPEGWVEVTHDSGMPLYLHKDTRVCTLAKPYFLGPGSVRKHKIPLAAIPCLNYRKALEEEALKQQVPMTPNLDVTYIGGFPFPNAKIETVQENFETHNLAPNQVREYCEKLFLFKTINVKKFKSWGERRKFIRIRKQLQRPTLPVGTKLITVPIQSTEHDSLGNLCPKKEWIMNPNGKNYVSILHEYVQHALKKPASFKFTTLENAATPHMATVTINDMIYGVGLGPSKKLAKNDAAKATLEMLIPAMYSKITADDRVPGSITKKPPNKDLSFFDNIQVEDPRVAELSAKATEPPPYEILETCLQRNFDMRAMDIKCHWDPLAHQKNEFSMTVGKHTATIVCQNKRDGKHRASQAILQAMHPHITSWGSILRLYGSTFVNHFTERKKEEKEIAYLQSKLPATRPNYAILNRLKEEMYKLKDSRVEIRSAETFIPPKDFKIPQLSRRNVNANYRL